MLEETPEVTAPSRSRLSWVAWAVAGVLASALGLVAYRHAPEETRVLNLSVLPPEKTIFKQDSVPAISPDGRRLAFVATADGKDSLWVRDLDSVAARPLPGTDGALDPFWSPDSRAIAFFAGGKLKKIEVAGGPALTLCNIAAVGLGGSWSKNGVILFATAAFGLFRVPVTGGNPILVRAIDQASGEFSLRVPWFLPDGRHFLYTAINQDPEKTAVYASALDSENRQRVMASPSKAMYAPPGYLLYVREQTLMAQPFDAGKLRFMGDAIPIAEQVNLSRFSASQNGILLFTSGGDVGQNAQLTWFDRSGKVLGTIGTPGLLHWGAISPNGKIVAVDRLDQPTGFYDLWLHDLTHGTASRFTFNSNHNQFPVWSPDGSHIAFESGRDGGVGSNVYQKATTGAGQDEAIDKAPYIKRPLDWSLDGRYIIEHATLPKTQTHIWVLPLFGDRKPFRYLQTASMERHAKLSPKGQWLAYVSDEAKRDEVYVQTFPTPGGKWQVSTNGGTFPVWSRDGKELFFIGANQKMMAVDVKSGAKFEPGVPRPLFDVRLLRGFNYGFDVSKDGWFLIPTQVEQSANAPMTVVVNWPAALKKP